MEEFKLRAEEKLEALHLAAKAVADGGKNRVQDVTSQTTELIRRIREALSELWRNDLFIESRERVAAWTRDAVQRIRDGTPPLSPVLLYEELVALFKDRMWRRSVALFALGAALGGSAGLLLGMRASSRTPSGPHARALIAQPDRTVLLVDDVVTPGAGAGEVLVRVQAFSVCARDRAALRGRAGALRALLGRAHIAVGRGFAGVVLDAGPGVSLELGDEVWGCVSEWSGGAACELLTVRSTRVSKRPRGLAADTAASLPWAGTLALAALDCAPYGPEEWKTKRVAVTGAASGEGLALLQLLGRGGARTAAVAPRLHRNALHDYGASEVIDVGGADESVGIAWSAVEQAAVRGGLWDAVFCCEGPGTPRASPTGLAAMLKAAAPRRAFIDLRPSALLTDRLPTPFWLLFCATFYLYRVLRLAAGGGAHTDWLEPPEQQTRGLQRLAELVDTGCLAPALDKVYLPQDFEAALAHACSDDAFGTTVIRFP